MCVIDIEAQAHAQRVLPLLESAARTIRTAPHRAGLQAKSSARDLVTDTDRQVEQFLRDGLMDLYPGVPVLGEEAALQGEQGHAEGVAAAGWMWVVDPLDGTTNFVHGLGNVGCLMALCHNGQPTFAATCDVFSATVTLAGLSSGCWRSTHGPTPYSGTPPSLGPHLACRVSTTESLANALLATGFSYDRGMRADDNRAETSAAIAEARDIRRLGSAGLDLAAVAAGRLDGYWEQGCGPWDWVGGALLVREAGGRVTTFGGADWQPGDPEIVASNGAIHDQLLDMIHRARTGAGLNPQATDPR